MWHDSIKLFNKKTRKNVQITKRIVKTEMNHDDVYGDNYKDKVNDWLPHFKNEVLCTAFSYARYFKAMQEITGFSMKDCLSLPGLGLKYFNSLRTEEDEPIYTYNDKYLRWSVRQAAYGGRVCAFRQYYKSNIYDNILNIISKELKIEENTYEKKEAYMKYKNTNILKSLKKNMKINLMTIELKR